MPLSPSSDWSAGRAQIVPNVQSPAAAERKAKPPVLGVAIILGALMLALQVWFVWWLL